MTLTDWFRRLFRGTTPDDESAEVEEYKLPDPGPEALRSDPAPSLFGGVEPPREEGLEAPPDPAP